MARLVRIRQLTDSLSVPNKKTACSRHCHCHRQSPDGLKLIAAHGVIYAPIYGPWYLERHPAVNQMGLPGDVARLVGGEENRDRGPLLGPAEPAQGLAFDERLLHLRRRFAGRARAILDSVLERGRFDGARTDGVGADAVSDEVGR